MGDRENNRLQVFDRDGAFLAAWGDFYHPMQIWVDDRDFVFVTDQIPRISLLSPDGKLVGRCRGAINGAHGLSGDAEGNLYLSELPPQEITKLERTRADLVRLKERDRVDKNTIEVLARRAGLDKALAEFPEDVDGRREAGGRRGAARSSARPIRRPSRGRR